MNEELVEKLEEYNTYLNGKISRVKESLISDDIEFDKYIEMKDWCDNLCNLKNEVTTYLEYTKTL